MKNALKTVLSFSLVVAAGTAVAHASVPEIDPSLSTGALALLAGATLVLRSRKR